MEGTLRGKRILVTRPAHQSQGWCQLLQAAGAKADVLPMLAIVPVESGPQRQAIKNQVLDFDQVEHAIFVSQNAVRIGFDWLEDYWPQLPQGPRYYAIGAATARALRERGVDCASDGDSMDSEALLTQPTLQQVAGQRILIFRGCGGRTLIGETLRERGGRVEYCELYRRCLPADAIDNLAAYATLPDAITVHSGETLANLAECIRASAQQRLLDVPVICPSPRVADQARQLGFSHCYSARNAGDTAMLETLQAFLR